MKKFLRKLLLGKQMSPEAEDARKAVEKAQLDAYTKAKMTYAVQLGEERAKFEYEEAKKKLAPKDEKKQSGFMAWLNEDSK